MIRKILMITIGALLSCNFMPIAVAATQSQIDFEKNRQASQQQFEQRSQQMQQQYQQGVANMQQEHQQRVADMQQQHQQNVDEMNRKSQQRLQEMRSNNQPAATQSSTSTVKPATNSGGGGAAVAPTTGNKNQPAAPANANATPPSAAITVKPAAKKSTDSSVTWLLGGGILAGGTVMALRKRKKIATAPFLTEPKSKADANTISIAGQNVSLPQGWQVAKEFIIKGHPVIATTGNAGIVLLVLCSGANIHISPTGWINYDEKEERYESPVKALKQMKAQLTEQLQSMNVFGEMIHLAILTTNSQAIIKGEESIVTLPTAGLDSWIGKLPKPDNCDINVMNKVITDLKWE